MAKLYIARLTCDRCGKVDEQEEVEGVAFGVADLWGVVTLETYVNGQWGSTRKDICPACVIEVEKVMDAL